MSDVIVALAAVAAALIAFMGLKTWSRELRGKATFEVARALIRATYALRDEIRYCRHRFIPASEFPVDAQSSSNGRTERAERLSHVYSNRFRLVAAAMNEFDSQVLEAESLWGREIVDQSRGLRRCVFELSSAIDAYISNEFSGGEDFACDRAFGVETRKVVHASGYGDDQFSRQVDASVKKIEASVRPLLANA